MQLSSGWKVKREKMKHYRKENNIQNKEKEIQTEPDPVWLLTESVSPVAVAFCDSDWTESLSSKLWSSRSSENAESLLAAQSDAGLALGLPSVCNTHSVLFPSASTLLHAGKFLLKVQRAGNGDIRKNISTIRNHFFFLLFFFKMEDMQSV